MPMERNSGALVFVLSVWDSVKKNFNLGDNFRTVRDRYFIFGMHTQLIKPFQMTPESMTLWPWPWPLVFAVDGEGGGSFVFNKHMFLL